MQRLETRADSSKTLARGMELVNQPLNTLLRVKMEAGDEDEKAMEAEMQARLLNSAHACMESFTYNSLSPKVFLRLHCPSGWHCIRV